MIGGESLRYRHFRVLRGSTVLVVILLLLILPVSLQSFMNFRRGGNTVAGNVWLAGNNVGGLQAEELRAVVRRLSEENHREPVDAVIDPENDGVIPGLSGWEVNEEQIMQMVLNAPPGAEIPLVFREVPARIQLSDFPEHPVYRGNPKKTEVTFLINVAWGNEYLPEMLDVLRENNAGATFFLVGRWVRGNPVLARNIADAGFELANHGDSDALSMLQASFPQALEDIKRANDTIEEICGVRPVYFSPHRGELTSSVLKAAVEEQCITVMWTLDTVDWLLPGVEVMLAKITEKATGGSLILMHPTEQTANLLRLAIPALRKNGLEPVTLSQMLSPSETRNGRISQ
jgi:peptidoglycan-N-acetylglucosamine deacetylase